MLSSNYLTNSHAWLMWRLHAARGPLSNVTIVTNVVTTRRRLPRHPYTNFRPEQPSSIVSKDQSDLQVIGNGNQQVLQEKAVEDVLRNKKSVTVTELSNASRRAQQILLNICRAEEKLGIKEIVISEGSLVYNGHEKGLQTPGWRTLLGAPSVAACKDHVYNDDCDLTATEAG
ncbi:hypothetical protein SI65_10213 [Aspergillus cristatus]|uniref:Uncharacterized protein n=1 Tax=Aspergillus cristatus TaxID=573508 RepID=A0A1E3B0C7_ASPCR|nr:hypothetical protein SI65_10213 [Aspergillus cristatus]